MFAPVTDCPTNRPAVDVTVTVVLALAVVIPLLSVPCPSAVALPELQRAQGDAGIEGRGVGAGRIEDQGVRPRLGQVSAMPFWES